MLRYSRYMINTILKRKTPYIILIGLFVVFNLTILLRIKEFNSNGVAFIDHITTFTKFFPFLFSTLFVATIVIYIFKQGEEDGTELMVIAKPISRGQIIIGKFLVLILFMLIFTLLLFIDYYILGVFDKKASSKLVLNFSASLSLGGLIVMIIIASILIIIASFLGKTNTLSIGIITAAIIPITSFIIAPLGKGQPFEQHEWFNSSYRLSQKVLSSISEKNKITKENAYDMFDTNELYHIEDEGQEEYKAYQKAMWYKYGAYADLWYQWGRFYSIFDEPVPSINTITNWKLSQKIMHFGKDDLIPLQNNEKWGFMINNGNLDWVIKVIPKEIKMAILLLESNHSFAQDFVNDHVLNSRMWALANAVNNSLEKLQYNPKDMSWKNYIYRKMPPQKIGKKSGGSSSHDAIIYSIVTSSKKWNILKSFNHVNWKNPSRAFDITKPIGFHTSYLLKDGASINMFIPKAFISTPMVLGTWISFSIILFGLSIFLFYRRDFK